MFEQAQDELSVVLVLPEAVWEQSVAPHQLSLLFETQRQVARELCVIRLYVVLDNLRCLVTVRARGRMRVFRVIVRVWTRMRLRVRTTEFVVTVAIDYVMPQMLQGNAHCYYFGDQHKNAKRAAGIEMFVFSNKQRIVISYFQNKHAQEGAHAATDVAVQHVAEAFSTALINAVPAPDMPESDEGLVQLVLRWMAAEKGRVPCSMLEARLCELWGKRAKHMLEALETRGGLCSLLGARHNFVVDLDSKLVSLSKDLADANRNKRDLSAFLGS